MQSPDCKKPFLLTRTQGAPEPSVRALSLSKNLFTAKKLRRISATNGGKKAKSVISGGVYVGNDTSHDGRGGASVIKPPCQKSPNGFFDSLSARTFRSGAVYINSCSLRCLQSASCALFYLLSVIFVRRVMQILTACSLRPCRGKAKVPFRQDI